MQRERFSVEEYLKNPSRKVVTGKGEKVRILCTDQKNRYPVVGLVAVSCDHEIAGIFSAGGEFSNGMADERDLYFEDKVGRFDPSAFDPFDRVLVRDGNNECWKPALFGYRRPGFSGVCIAGDSFWNMCVPYNDETKGLLGTDEDCPDYYKWWED